MTSNTLELRGARRILRDLAGYPMGPAIFRMSGFAENHESFQKLCVATSRFAPTERLSVSRDQAIQHGYLTSYGSPSCQ